MFTFRKSAAHAAVLCCFEATWGKSFRLLQELVEVVHFELCSCSQCFVPSKAEGLVQKGSELIGKLFYKEGLDLYHWRKAWFALRGSALHFSRGEDEEEEDVLQLKQLQELSKLLTRCVISGAGTLNSWHSISEAGPETKLEPGLTLKQLNLTHNANYGCERRTLMCRSSVPPKFSSWDSWNFNSAVGTEGVFLRHSSQKYFVARWRAEIL